MKIFIITMDDPVYTIPFIRKVIKERKKDIIGIATAKGDRLKIGKNRSKLIYIFSLFLIMGFRSFIKHSFITLIFKIRKKLSEIFRFFKSPSILRYAEDHNIKTYSITSPNNKNFLNILRENPLN